MARLRPTPRVLRQDLKLPIPPITVPLDEIAHPLVAKAAERFADPDAGHERIRSIGDEVLFETRVQRRRGAVLRLVPGCDPETWHLETAAFIRDLEPDEQLWSDPMDPIAAARLLGAAGDEAGRAA